MTAVGARLSASSVSQLEVILLVSEFPFCFSFFSSFAMTFLAGFLMTVAATFLLAELAN